MEIDYIKALSAIGVILLGILQWRNTSRSSLAESNAVDVGTFQKLVSEVKAQSKEQVETNKRVTELEKKNVALWHYVYQLLDFILEKKLVPPLPPTELETDPRITRIFQKAQ